MSFRVALLSLVGLSLAACQTTSGKPVACADEVKKTLANTTWKLTTEFTNSDGTQSYTVRTSVTADGKMYVHSRGRNLNVTCSGREISFDWRNDPNRKYTLTFENAGVFNGYRTGNRSDYNATLKKI